MHPYDAFVRICHPEPKRLNTLLHPPACPSCTGHLHPPAPTRVPILHRPPSPTCTHPRAHPAQATFMTGRLCDGAPLQRVAFEHLGGIFTMPTHPTQATFGAPSSQVIFGVTSSQDTFQVTFGFRSPPCDARPPCAGHLCDGRTRAPHLRVGPAGAVPGARHPARA